MAHWLQVDDLIAEGSGGGNESVLSPIMTADGKALDEAAVALKGLRMVPNIGEYAQLEEVSELAEETIYLGYRTKSSIPSVIELAVI